MVRSRTWLAAACASIPLSVLFLAVNSRADAPDPPMVRAASVSSAEPAPAPPPPAHPCDDIGALHAGTGAAERQRWFDTLSYQDYARYWMACVDTDPAAPGIQGWGEDQWRCLLALNEHESGWSATARNPTSGAYGLPQSLPGSKMASHGADWRTSGRTQLRWQRQYIEDRYGLVTRVNGGRCRGPY